MCDVSLCCLACVHCSTLSSDILLVCMCDVMLCSSLASTCVTLLCYVACVHVRRYALVFCVYGCAMLSTSIFVLASESCKELKWKSLSLLHSPNHWFLPQPCGIDSLVNWLLYCKMLHQLSRWPSGCHFASMNGWNGVHHERPRWPWDRYRTSSLGTRLRRRRLSLHMDA